MFFGAINSLEYSKIHLNHQNSFFGQKYPHFCFQISIMIGVYLYVFGTINSLEYSKIHLNHQKPLFWPVFEQNGQKSPHFGQK